MADVVPESTRSRMMAGVRSRNTGIEMSVRRLLHREGYRYRLHVKDLPGRPDIVLPRYEAVIQVNGCFWHRHDCRLFKLPSTNTGFWQKKLDRNHQRDLQSNAELEAGGWRVLVVWECALRLAEGTDHPVGRLVFRWLEASQGSGEIRDRNGSPVLIVRQLSAG